jgi:hypothetical protein
MCFYTQQHASIKEVAKRLNSVDDSDGFLVSRQSMDLLT